MPLPVPSMDDIYSDITASARSFVLRQHIEALHNFVSLWQDSRQQLDDSTSCYLESMKVMLDTIYSRACDVENSLERFSEYIR